MIYFGPMFKVLHGNQSWLTIIKFTAEFISKIHFFLTRLTLTVFNLSYNSASLQFHHQQYIENFLRDYNFTTTNTYPFKTTMIQWKQYNTVNKQNSLDVYAAYHLTWEFYIF